MVALASCQNVDGEPAGPGPAAADPAGQASGAALEPPAQEGYPELYTVPPRPTLSYTVEQRRAIVDGLVADRENARYTSQVVRYRSGLSELPPPEAPPAPAQAADSVAALPGTVAVPAPQVVPSEQRAFEAETEVIYDDDDLGTFMEEMLRRTAPVTPAEGAPPKPEANAAPGISRIAAQMAEPVRRPGGAVTVIPASMTRPAPDPPEPQVAAADSRRTVPPTPALRPTLALGPPVPRPEVISPATAPQQVAGVTRPRDPAPLPSDGDGAGIGVTGGLLVVDVDHPGSPALPVGATAAPTAFEQPVGVIAFDPGSARLPPDTTAHVAQLLTAAKGRTKPIKVVAEGPSPVLAPVRAGVPADQVEVSPVGDAPGDRAGVFLASQAMP